MNVDRRTVVKGIVAGGAILATGGPRWLPRQTDAAVVVKPPVLVLGGSACDAPFAAAAQDAAKIVGADTIPTVTVATADLEAVAMLFRTRPATRFIGIMDDAAYAIFHESVRAAGGRLLCLNRHGPRRGAFRSRHAVLSTPAVSAIGATLASYLAEADGTGLVTELRVGTSDRETNIGVSGYRSFDVDDSLEPRVLHAAGMSPTEACQLLGIDSARLTPRPAVRDCGRSAVARRCGWIEIVARALVRTSFGTDTAAVPRGVNHVFLRRGVTAQPDGPTGTYVTFVVDV